MAALPCGMARAKLAHKRDDISTVGKGTKISPAWEETPSCHHPNRAGQIKGVPAERVLFGRAVRVLTPRAPLLLIRLMEADVA